MNDKSPEPSATTDDQQKLGVGLKDIPLAASSIDELSRSFDNALKWAQDTLGKDADPAAVLALARDTHYKQYLVPLITEYIRKTQGEAKADAFKALIGNVPEGLKEEWKKVLELFQAIGKQDIDRLEDYSKIYMKSQSGIIDKAIAAGSSPYEMMQTLSSLGMLVGGIAAMVGQASGNQGWVEFGQGAMATSIKFSEEAKRGLLKQQELLKLIEKRPPGYNEDLKELDQRLGVRMEEFGRRLEKLNLSPEIYNALIKAFIEFEKKNGASPEEIAKAEAELKAAAEKAATPPAATPSTPPAPLVPDARTGAAGVALVQRTKSGEPASAAAAPVAAPVAKGKTEPEINYVDASDFEGLKFRDNNYADLYSKDGKTRLKFKSPEEGIAKLRVSLIHNIAHKDVTLGALIKKMYPASKTLLGKVSVSTGIDKDAKLTTKNIEPLIRGIITGLQKPIKTSELSLDQPTRLAAATDKLAQTTLAHYEQVAFPAATIVDGSGGGTAPKVSAPNDPMADQNSVNQTSRPTVIVGRDLTKEEAEKLRNVPTLRAPEPTTMSA